MLTFTNAATNIVLDGHSQVAGAMVAGSDRLGDQLMRLPPINGGMTYQMLGQNGDTYKGMTAAIGTVHAAYQAGKQNLLYVWEAHNTAETPRPNGSPCTVADVLDDCRAYISAVKSTGQNWRIFLIIETAVKDDDPRSPVNAVIDGYNAYVRANYKALGVEGYIDTRPPGGPLAYIPPYTYTDMYGSESRWIKGGYYADYVHMNAAGYGVIAQYMATQLQSLPDTAPVYNPSPDQPSTVPTVTRVVFVSAGKTLLLGASAVFANVVSS